MTEDHIVPSIMRILHTDLSLCTRRHTSPGPDGIFYIMMRYVPDKLISFFVDIYNAIWRNSFVSATWKSTIVIHTLTAYMMKPFEKMVNTRLVWVFKIGGHLFPMQNSTLTLYHGYFSATEGHHVRRFWNKATCKRLHWSRKGLRHNMEVWYPPCSTLTWA